MRVIALTLTMGMGLVHGSIEAADGAWSQWRGPNRDGKSLETGLLKDWPSGGPQLLWTFRKAGNGYSGPAVVDGILYTQGSDDQGEFVLALKVADGTEAWRTNGSSEVFNVGQWGEGPRGTPTVDGDFVYALLGKGNILCLDRKTGAKKWSKNLVSDFGGKVPYWGYSESPLIDGDKIIVTPGGQNFMVALNKSSGETIWKGTGISDGAQYSSAVVATAGDVRMYVIQSDKHFLGFDANSGKMLWSFGEIGRRTAVIPTPIVAGDLVYVTAGYGAGCECLRLKPSGSGAVDAEKVYVNRNIVNHHGGVILHKGHIFGHSDQIPSSALKKKDENQVEVRGGQRRRGGPNGWCFQNLQTGELKWHQSREGNKGLGKGSVTFADDRFYCYDERSGECVLVDATENGWEEHGRMKLPEQTKIRAPAGMIWTHPVVAEGKLFLRDQDLIFCFDVKAK
jgi:outer membrane protein assembly factor BamB